MVLNALLVALSATFPQVATCQVDDVGSGHALSFDGVNDYVALGNVYDSMHLPLTLSAWVKLHPRASTPPGVSPWMPVFTSQDREANFISDGFWLILQPNAISTGYGDGKGADNPAFRRSKTIFFGDGSLLSDRWALVTVVLKGATDMNIYVNGVDVGGDYTGTTNFPMSSSSLDSAMIGHHFSNGYQYWFDGEIDDLRIWSRALDVNEIRTYMCRKLKGNETGLAAYWALDETDGNVTRDASTAKLSGALRNGVSQVFSGAPLGDSSVYLYPPAWTGQQISMKHKGESITVDQVDGTSNGMQVYLVDSPPSRDDGLPTACTNPFYFGVFADAPGPAGYRVGHEFANGLVPSDTVFERSDNSLSTWSSKNIAGTNTQTTLTGEIARGEYIFPFHSTISFDLGADIDLCKSSDAVLQFNGPEKGATFEWSNGSTEPSINISTPGLYWLKATNGCGTATDSVRATYHPYDSLFIPNFISPNGDKKNDFFQVDDRIVGKAHLLILNRWGKEVYESASYFNNWSGGGLPSGIYFYLLEGGCVGIRKGTLTIIR